MLAFRLHVQQECRAGLRLGRAKVMESWLQILLIQNLPTHVVWRIAIKVPKVSLTTLRFNTRTKARYCWIVSKVFDSEHTCAAKRTVIWKDPVVKLHHWYSPHCSQSNNPYRKCRIPWPDHPTPRMPSLKIFIYVNCWDLETTVDCFFQHTYVLCIYPPVRSTSHAYRLYQQGISHINRAGMTWRPNSNINKNYCPAPGSTSHRLYGLTKS